MVLPQRERVMHGFYLNSGSGSIFKQHFIKAACLIHGDLEVQKGLRSDTVLFEYELPYSWLMSKGMGKVVSTRSVHTILHLDTSQDQRDLAFFIRICHGVF